MFARFALVTVALLGLVGCGSSAGAGSTSKTTPPVTSTAPLTTPTPTSGYPTAEQAADAGARASGDVPCSDQFPGTQDLLVDTVGVYTYTAGPCGPGGHALMLVWVFRDSGGWHPYTWAATQVGNMPSDAWGQHIPMQTGGGCVNARAQPSLSGAVVTCLGASATVIPAASSHSPWHPPVLADGYIWWYVFRLTGGSGSSTEGTPLGWVVLDYLVCGQGPRNLNQGC